MCSNLVKHEASGEMTSVTWYAVYTKHQHEKTASDLLARKGFEVLLPLYRATHRWKDRVKTVLIPLFPSYVFVRTSLEKKLDILRTPGVFWLVGHGGRAFPVPEREIEAVRKITQSSAHFEPHPFLKYGDLVRVRVGPLAGVTGILKQIKNQYRVVLSVGLLQKAVAVEVDLSVLERVHESCGKGTQAGAQLVPDVLGPQRLTATRIGN
jgi:transcription antitermination factor NusG